MSIINTIQLITKYSTKAWDKVYKAESMASLLDDPNDLVQWRGTKTVLIPKFQAGGLGNYYRNNDGDPRVAYPNEAVSPFGPFGYPTSNVGMTWEERTVRMDRAARYPIELFDNEETDGLALGAATTEISRTIMIPEIDAYTFSTIASEVERLGAGNYITTAISENDDAAYTELNDALVYFEEHEVPAERQIIFVSPRYMNLLRSNSKAISRLLQSDMSKNVKFSISQYEGRDIVVVPPARFRTHVDLRGKGVAWYKDSKPIDFMVVAKDAVMHVTKYNEVKIIGGDANLAGSNFDGWSIFARVYHDVFVLDNKTYALYVRVSGDSKLASKENDIMVTYNSDKVVTSVSHNAAGRLLSYGVVVSENAPEAVPESLTELKVGITLPNGTVWAYAYEDKAIVAATKIGTIA